MFKTGDKVRVVGCWLKSLNGIVGTVVSFNPQRAVDNGISVLVEHVENGETVRDGFSVNELEHVSEN